MVSCQSRNAALALRAEFLRSSCPGSTRASIAFKKLDCRVKPGNDNSDILEVTIHGDP
jgi:hypothetical protein